MFSSGLDVLDGLVGNGYPDRSAILVVGPPGVGKEALGYWFLRSGLMQGDFGLYVTRLSVGEVWQDIKGFGIDGWQREPLWFASEGGQIKCNLNDLAALSFNIKEALKKNADRKIRVVTDVLSPLLMLNPPETIYKFFSQLSSDLKQYDAVLLATIEEGMHQPQIIAAMQQLFDGVMELRLYEQGLSVVLLFRIRKMRGVLPQLGLFNFAFSRGRVEISPYAK